MDVFKESYNRIMPVRVEHYCDTIDCMVHSNWGTECDANFKGYHNGNTEPQGFGQ